jgi:catechol 2,3-dioxygenase-like lactoylglutathione lyase family enzyme
MIEGISAVTLGTHDMPRAVRFYRALGFELLHGNEEGASSAFEQGRVILISSLSLPSGAGPGGAASFSTSPMSMRFTNARAAGYQPTTSPRDAEWGERFFHMDDPDGHELSFARPLQSGVDASS